MEARKGLLLRENKVPKDKGSPSGVRISLLGNFALTLEGEPMSAPRNTQRLLAFLALGDRPVRRSRVAESLWADSSDAQAAGNLRTELWRLKREVNGLLRLTGDQLSLGPGVSVDFRGSLAIAHGMLSPDHESDAREEDIGALSSDLLPDWEEEWLVFERERFRELRLHALEALSANLASIGRYGPAIEAGQAAVAADPLRESAHRALIRVYLQEGNVGGALRHYQEFQRLLLEELSIKPSAAMQELVAGISNSLT